MCYTQHIMLHYVDCSVCSKVCYQFWERELSGGKGRKFGSDEESCLKDPFNLWNQVESKVGAFYKPTGILVTRNSIFISSYFCHPKLKTKVFY